jgi:Fe-Mn family superoxide dismutase
MSIELPKLPWAANALAPHISEETISYHYGKHHAGYVKKLNAALPDSEFSDMSLEQIIMNASGGLFNNAAQIWNHSFYWNCLSPNGGGEPTGKVLDAIFEVWGSFEDFKAAFTTEAKSNFGSGWTWLVKNSEGELEISSTDNAGCPLTDKQIPILTIDVWEHAYYIDYRNSRPNYIEAYWNLVNWEFANDNM